MSWQDYFERKDTSVNDVIVSHYVYKDKAVKALPADLPMPPMADLTGLFFECEQLQDVSALANWDVSNVTRMQLMFADCKQLQDISALSQWNTSNVTDMNCMFNSCRELKDNTAISNWDLSNVRDMDGMFYACDELQTISVRH